VFSHVLILKHGRTLAAGNKSGLLTSRLLSRAFNARAKLRTRAGRYTMRVLPKRDVVI
jgi:ABC-type cobalamin/Fe3+-siderophores transport system ATPase subunit